MANLRRIDPSNLPDSGKVWIACRLPNGLRLDLPLNPGQMPDGIHVVPEYTFATLRGWSIPVGTFNSHVVDNCGITQVDAQKFKEWYRLARENKLAALVNDQIFACEREEDLRAQAREEVAKPILNPRLNTERLPNGLKHEGAE
jgi:hypothetical protein